MEQLPEGWWWSGLPGLEAAGTYQLIPLERLPKIRPESIRSWDWIPDVASPLAWSIGDSDDAEAFLRAASAADVLVSERFRSFISTPRLRWAIRSGTGCWWSLGRGRGVPVRAEIANALGFEGPSEHLALMAYVPGVGRHVVRFLTDQQDSLFWFLMLGDDDGAVLVSGRDLMEEPAATADDVWKVATTFQEFIYRFWIENEISFRTEEGVPLSEEQQAYLSEAIRLAAASTVEEPGPRS